MTFLAVEFPWRRKESIRTHPDHLSFLVHLPRSQVCSVDLKTQRKERPWPTDEVTRGGGRKGENMEQMFYNPNLRTVILQGERYLKKRKKKKSNGFSGILFSVHIQAIVPVQAAVSRACDFSSV